MSNNSNSESQSRLADPLRGYAIQGLAGASSLYNDEGAWNTPSSYISPGTFNDSDYEQRVQMGQLRGSMVPREALQEYERTIRGDYLNNNEYLDDIVNRSVGASQRGIRGAFGGGGRFGSGAFANAAFDSGTETANRIYGDQYSQERQRMMQALGLAPQMEQLQYADTLAPYLRQSLFEESMKNNPLSQESDTIGNATSPFNWGSAVPGIIGGAGQLAKGVADYYKPGPNASPQLIPGSGGGVSNPSAGVYQQTV